MAISLAKGQKVDLTKGNSGLDNLVVGLGWDVNQYDGQAQFDLDTSVFALTAEGVIPTDSAFVYYGNKSYGNAIIHSGDNLTGEGSGDDEQIMVCLSALPAEIDKLAFTVTIYDAGNRNQNFGQVRNAYIRVSNKVTGEELLRFDLSEDFSIETAVVVAEIYRHNGEWKFAAVGSGYMGGLEALCRNYGADV